MFERIGIDVDPAHELDYTNAQRILEASDVFTAAEAQAGDLIFFENTYPTSGASHVGIIVQPGTMLDDHTRSPYGPGETDYTSSYWISHFLCCARVKH